MAGLETVLSAPVPFWLFMWVVLCLLVGIAGHGEHPK